MFWKEDKYRIRSLHELKGYSIHLQIATLFHLVDGATLWLSQYKNKVSCELLEDYFPSVQNCFKNG